jgi:ribosomal protein S3AE
MEKSCENCRKKFTFGCDGGNCYKTLEGWKPNHQTLESNLEKANSLIKEQIKQIAIKDEALRLMASILMHERCEQPLEQDIKNEIDYWVRKAQSNQQVTNG